MNIYLDIETIPTQNPELIKHVSENVKAPGNYKDPEKIAAYIAEAADSEVLKTSFDGAYGHIICISYAIGDSDPSTLNIETVDDEKLMLEMFYSGLNAFVGDGWQNPVFVCHNIQGFDLPFLKKRSMILGVKPSPIIRFNSKPWDANPYDTMMQWDAKNFASLDKLCKAFCIDGKGDVDGSMVYEMWKAGKHQEISDYCYDDVIKVRQLYYRMEYLG